jgi:hypothetical protein
LKRFIANPEFEVWRLRVMPKAQEFIAFANQCDQLARRFPEHANALRDMAATWRLLAEKVRAENGNDGATEPPTTAP